MQRRKLKKEIRKYAKQVKFYKYGLISRYLKHLAKEKERVVNAVPSVICPYCNSKNIFVEYSDIEYSSDKWLSCDKCGEDFEDTYGYIEATEAFECMPWWDSIYNAMQFDDDIDFASVEWQKYCENEILETIKGVK